MMKDEVLGECFLHSECMTEMKVSQSSSSVLISGAAGLEHLLVIQPEEKQEGILT
jgi:hypothetical protein